MSSFEQSTNWDNIFVGRKAVIEKILDSQEDFFIFGARRIGKTSLLKFVEEQFRERKIAAFYLSIQGYSESDKLKRKIRNCFKRKKINFDESLFNDFSFFDFLEELNLKLLRLNQKFVFLMDEVEQIADIEKAEKGFIDRFRNSAESLDNIRFILTASPHFRNAFVSSRCSAFLSAFDVHMLPVMTIEETTDLMKEMIHDIEPDEIEQLLQFTHFQPYLIKIFLGKLLLTSGGELAGLLQRFIPDITENEVRQMLEFDDYQPDLVKIFIGKLSQKGVLQPALKFIAGNIYVTNALEGIFPNYFEGLGKADQEIVRQIHQKRFEWSGQYETKLRELTEYGYLKYEAGTCEISNWFFRHWLDEKFGAPEESEEPETQEDTDCSDREYPAEEEFSVNNSGSFKADESLVFSPSLESRTLLDIGTAAVLGYGLYRLAETFIAGCRVFAAENSGFFSTLLNHSGLHDNLAMILFFISAIFMLSGDYVCRRILSGLAPGRTNFRFLAEAGVAFFFGIGFIWNSCKHPWVWGVVGEGFLISGLWGFLAEKDAKEWQKHPVAENLGIRAGVINWNLYSARLSFIINSNLLIGVMMIAIMCLLLATDNRWYHICSILFFIICLISESLRYVAERGMLIRYVAASGSAKESLTTFAYSLYSIRNILKTRTVKAKKEVEK